MNRSLVICASCRCHVHAGERWCPHCDADLAAEGGLYLVQRRRIEIHRMVLAVAVAGLGPVACGSSTPDVTVQGSCAEVVSPSCLHNCDCGSRGQCNAHGQCVSCGCAASTPWEEAHQYCDAGGCSTRPCYGAPPVLT